MEHFNAFGNEILDHVANLAILMFESAGVIILILAGIKGVWSYITQNPHTRLNLAKGMAMSLEFKLGGEILRTVIVRQWSELSIVAGLIVIRAALTFLIHWEIQGEEKQQQGKL